jgi:hypothetical protein
MAEKKSSPVTKFSMSVTPNETASLGYWPPELDHRNNGWTGTAFQVHRAALDLGKRYSDQNDAIRTAQLTNAPPPDLGDIRTRGQRAREDYKRLGELGRKLQAIEQEVTQKQSQLKAFDYSNDTMRDALLRQERRAHMRTGMNERERMEALRDPAWKKAALEQPASLSGVSESFHQATYDDELRSKYGPELQGISEGRAAINAVVTVMSAVERALEYELKVTEVGAPGPAPTPSAPWVKD